MFKGGFPRKPEEEELNILYRILPADKPGYQRIRELIKDYYIIGKGSSDEMLVLSRTNDLLYVPFITPVFAAGTFVYNGRLFDVIIHEELEETIELSVDIKEKVPDNFKDNIYPEWVPGMKAPGDGSDVREVVVDEKHVLVLAPVHKRLWLYDNETGVNHFLTPGAFYSNLCMVKNIREPEKVLNPKLLFENLANYHDNELISAFYLYNKSLKKFRIEIPVEKKAEKKSGFFRSFLKKDKN
jgi:hypothetical protein